MYGAVGAGGRGPGQGVPVRPRRGARRVYPALRRRLRRGVCGDLKLASVSGMFYAALSETTKPIVWAASHLRDSTRARDWYEPAGQHQAAVLDRVWHAKASSGEYALSGIFRQLPTRAELPDYYQKIARPMDLVTVKKKVADGEYPSLKELEADITLMLANAQKYDDLESRFFLDAPELQGVLKQALLDELNGKFSDKFSDQSPGKFSDGEDTDGVFFGALGSVNKGHRMHAQVARAARRARGTATTAPPTTCGGRIFSGSTLLRRSCSGRRPARRGASTARC